VQQNNPKRSLKGSDPFLPRQMKTSEPRFKRLSRISSPPTKLPSQHAFKNPNKTYALDNSK
jgi:hypothetical protein